MTWWTFLLVPGVGCLAVAGWQWRRLVRDQRAERARRVLGSLRRLGSLTAERVAVVTDLEIRTATKTLKWLERRGQAKRVQAIAPDGEFYARWRAIPEPEPQYRRLSSGGPAAPPDEPGGAA